MTRITRSPGCDISARNQQIEDIALALLGVGDLADTSLTEGATWDRSDGAVTGRHAIQARRAALPRCDSVQLEQVVSHGKAGTASGYVTRTGQGTRLFCHVIRFTSAKAGQIAQIVSFEHAGGRRHGG